MFSMIPPVGVPFGWRTVFPRPDNAGQFARLLAERLGGQCSLTSSGKAALWLALVAMHAERPDRNEVILPDYTCWTVPSAVVRAGLRVKPVDIESSTLGLDPDKTARAISPRTLAVVVTHLFGVPSRIDVIESICRDKGIYLIDDAAQAFGATLNGKPIGAYGDIGILSFGRGKNITTGNGGAVLTRRPELQKRADKIFQRDMAVQPGSIADKIQMAVYKSFFSRRLFWIPARIPFLHLGETEYNPNFEAHKMSDDRAGRGLLMLAQSAEILSGRQKIAACYREKLHNAGGLNLLEPQPGSSSADLRFPVILADQPIRATVLAEGRRYGISGMYPDTISAGVGLSEAYFALGVPNPVSRLVADQLVTLPTHHGISEVDVDTICRFLMTATK
jgi:perosamine synthetase